MALATQCPHCHTTFRVAYDQLKLRAGMVRCGVCQQIFNGMTYLLPSDAEDISAQTTSFSTLSAQDTSSSPQSEPALSVSAQAKQDSLAPLAQIEPAPTSATAKPSLAPEAAAWQPRKFSDPLLEKPLSVDEPEFVKQGRRQERFGTLLKIGKWASFITLFLSALAQVAFIFGEEIAASWPQTRPHLTTACAKLGCDIGLPMQINAVSIESSQLQSTGKEKNIFELTVLLRNQSQFAQAWPHIELTLNDTANQLLARRVFAPQDFGLTRRDTANGIAAESEQPLKVAFEVVDAKASGYRLFAFYP